MTSKQLYFLTVDSKLIEGARTERLQGRMCVCCLLYFYFFKLYIASYNVLNINRVICKVEVRKGREAGTIHRWFTGALLLG